jgi:hypothetical protein
MIVATGTFVPAEKMLFEHRRNGLMEPYEATLAKISFANDQSFRGNILEAQRQRCGICSDSVGIAGGHFRYLATPQNADFQASSLLSGTFPPCTEKFLSRFYH